MKIIQPQKTAPKLDFNIQSATDKSLINASYIAGIFDGEGCISIYKKKKAGFKVHVSIEMRDPQAIKYIASVFGITVIHGKRKDEKHIMYRVSMNNVKSLKMLNMIYPFLKVKKTQAKIAIDMLAYKNSSAAQHPYDKRVKKFEKWASDCKRLKKSSWHLA